MVDFMMFRKRRAAVAGGAALLLALGAAGGAGAVQLTRPAVEMAPTVATPVVRLAASSGVVTVRGRVAEVFGDRFVVQDTSGRAMVAAGRDAGVRVGQPVRVQGRFDDGQLHASYLVDADGKVVEVGPRPHGGAGPDPRGPGHRGPPPPPPGCGPVPGSPAGPGAVPPPPAPPATGEPVPPPPAAPQR